MSNRIRFGAVVSTAFLGFVASSAMLVSTTAWGQGIPGPSVNIIGPTPDVYNLVPDKGLKQQNEVHCSVRPDDPLIAFCGYNDYRTTELTDDAWVGASMTRDGGLTWMSRVVPGWPLYTGGAGPIGHDFAADPNTAAVPGLLLYNFIAADRGKKGTGGLFLQRWFESDKENGFPYVPSQDTILITKGTSCPQCSGRFIDKPHMIATLDVGNGRPPVDVWGTLEDGTVRNAKVPAGELHVVYSVFTGSKQDGSKILHSRSMDWGATWSVDSKITESVDINQSANLVARGNDLLVVWRRFDDNNETNALMFAMSRDRGATWDSPQVLSELSCPYDQPTRNNMFRTTVHPVAATDGNKFYVFWSQRGEDPILDTCDFGLSRIVMMTSSNGVTWEPPVAIDNGYEVQGKGFQFMPSVTSANGVLQLAWYDTRDSLLQIHNEGVMDVLFPESDTLRYGLIGKHTADVRGMQIINGAPASASMRISTYPMVQAPFLGVGKAIQVGHNLVNARMFAGGKVPFMGDYISVAARGARLDASGKWVNNQAPGAAVPETFYTAWTDNRDTRGDLWRDLSDNDTTTYTPSNASIPPKATLDLEPGSESNPSYREWSCDAFGVTDRTRDQNVYATTVKPGAAVSLPTPSKQLGSLQRGFVVNVENTDRSNSKDFTICIDGQPDDYIENSADSTGLASFSQFPAPIGLFGLGTAISPVRTLQISVPPQSNSAQSVYVTSLTDQFPRIPVNVYEGTHDCSSGSRGTLVSTVVINGNQLARPVLDPNADPVVACEPGTTDPSTGQLCKPTDGTLASIADLEVHTPEIINYIWSLYHVDAETINAPELNSAFLEALVMNPLIMTKDAYGNPLIMTRDVTNPLIMTRDGGTNPLIMTRDDTTNPLIMTRDDTTNPLIMTRDDVTNPLIMTVDKTTNPLIMTKDGTTNPLVMTRDDTANPLIMTRDDPTNPLIMTRDGAGNPLIMTRDETGNPLVMTRDQYDNPLVMTRDGDGTRVMLPGDTFLNAGGTYDFPEGYVEVTWLVENEGNTITAYNAMPQVPGDSLLDEDGNLITSQLIVTKPYLTYASRNCVPGMQVQNQILLNSVNPFTENMVETMVTVLDDDGNPVLDDEGNPVEEGTGEFYWDGTYRVDPGKATFFSGPGEEATVTLRVFDPTFNPRRLGFSVQSQSCDSDELDCVIEPLAEIVADTTPPTTPTPFGISPTNNVPATGPGGATVTWNATSSEDAVSVTCSSFAEEYVGVGGAFSGLFPIGSTEVTCSASDLADNTSSASFTVIVEDVTPPVLVVPEEEVVAEAGLGGVAPVSFTTSANDYGGTVTLGSDAIVCSAENSSGTSINSVVSGTEFGLGAWTVTCVATDGVGLTTTETFTVTVADTTPPVLVKPDDITGVEATSSAGAPVTFGLPSASDLVGVTELYCVPASGSTFSLVDPVTPVPSDVICTAKDAAGNTATTSFQVTVVDTTKPVFDPELVDKTGSTTGLTDTISFTPVAVDYAKDSVTDVVDTSVDIACSYSAVGGDSSTYTALTAVGGTYSHDFPVGDTAVNCSATDDHGNRFDDSFLVTVSDIGLPDVTVPSNITEEATGPDGAVVYFDATAEDLISGTLAATCSITLDASGNSVSDALGMDEDAASDTYGQFTDVFPLGTTTVTCSATDDASNSDSASFNITVQDTTAPVLTVTGNPSVPVEATGFDGAPVTFNVDVLEVVTTGLSASCTDESDRTVASGVTAFAIGSHTVNCSATDGAGLEGSATFSFEVVDTTVPVLNLVAPTELTPEATSSDGATLSFSVSATDVAWAEVGLSCTSIPSIALSIETDGSVSAQFGLDTTTVTCKATDGAGLFTTRSFTVTVEDTTEPVLTLSPPATVHEADSAAGKLVSYSVYATDTVGDVTLVCKAGSDVLPVGTEAAPSVSHQFPLGTTNVTCTATDGSEGTNPVAGGFSVTVQDTTAPILTLVKPSEDPFGADSLDGVSVSYSVSAVDVNDVSEVTLECAIVSGDDLSTGDTSELFAMGETVVNCTATDAAGNPATDSFTVKVHYGSFIGLDLPNGMSGTGDDTRLDLGETALGSYSRSIPLYWQYGDTSGVPMDSDSAVPTAHIDRFGKLANGSCDFLSQPVDAEDSGNSSMRYNRSSQSWKFSWKPSSGAGCYGITIQSGLTGQEDGPYLFELR